MANDSEDDTFRYEMKLHPQGDDVQPFPVAPVGACVTPLVWWCRDDTEGGCNCEQVQVEVQAAFPARYKVIWEGTYISWDRDEVDAHRADILNAELEAAKRFYESNLAPQPKGTE